ncbi:MAG: hypothetical protein A2Y17_01445 [Clostridiales bacterium GWF2_38_85]|nr:MAG: hypothetical protein A2Y17_01445 [Clostridiales bacterium GWF2_38_85]HBL85185.1 hypothetical protein [Clostridiales bacterium]
MKRLIKISAICSVLLILFAVPVFAYEDELTNSIAADIGDSDYDEYVDKDEVAGDKDITIAAKLLQVLSDSISEAFKKVFGSFSILAGILIAASLLSGLKGDNPALSNTYDYISVLVLSAAVFNIAQVAFTITATALKTITTFSLAYIPITTTLYTLGGNPVAAAANWSTMSLYLTLVETVESSVLMPLLLCCFALCLVSALPSCVQLGSLSSLIRNSVTTILAFLFSMLSFVLYFQTTIAAAADSQAMRTVKFASGVFVPVIGSIIGEAAKSVYTSVGMIKATAGAAGVVTMLSIVIPPFIFVVAAKLSILLAGMLGRILGLERESRFLYEVNSLFGVLLAILIGASVVFFLSVAVFINTNAGQI